MQVCHHVSGRSKSAVGRFSAGLFVAFCCLLTPRIVLADTGATAEELRHIKRPIVGATLRGDDGAASQMLKFGDPGVRTGDPILALDFSISGATDPKRSLLTLLVDGQPERSWELHTLLAPGAHTGRIETALRSVPQGFHKIELVARLRDVNGDVCADRQRVWLRLRPGTVRWTEGERRARQARVQSRPISAFASVWQGHRAVSIRTLVADGEATVGVRAMPAILRIDHMVRRQGLIPIWPGTTLAPVGEEAPFPEVVLTQSPEAFAKAAGVDLPHALEPQELATHLNGSTLVLFAGDFGAMVAALPALEDAAVLALCQGPQCVFGPYKHALDASLTPSVVALTFRSLGLKEPHTARGFGNHAVQVSFSPPKHWDVTGRPVLHLNVLRAPDHFAVHDESGLTVELNGQPIGSLGLGRKTHRRSSIGDDGIRVKGGWAQQLVVAIPRWAREAAQWTFTIRTRWASRDDRCDARKDASGPWLSVQPDSALVLPRAVYRPTSIAGLAALASETIDVAVEGSLLMAQLAHAAPVLAALAPSKGVTWRLVPRCAQTLCVHIGSTVTSAKTAPMQRIDTAGSAVWFDPTGQLRMPRLPVSGTSFLSVRSSDSTDGSDTPGFQLLVPEEPLQSTGVVPDVLQLRTAWAASRGDGWLGIESPVDASSRPREPVATFGSDVGARGVTDWTPNTSPATGASRRGAGIGMSQSGTRNTETEHSWALAAQDEVTPTDEFKRERLSTIAWVVAGIVLLLLLWRLLRNPSIKPMDPDDVEWHAS